MRMKKLISLLLLLPALASADPSPATQYLLDEPANMMDVGNIRLAAAMKNNSDLIRMNYEWATGISDVLLYTSVGYNLEADKINIHITVELGSGVYDVTKAELGCRDIVTKMTQQIRYWVGITFSHDGLEENKPDKALTDPLSKRIDVYCTVRTIPQAITGEALVKIRKNLASDEVEVIAEDGE